MVLQLQALWQELATVSERPAFRRVDDTHALDLYAIVLNTNEPGITLISKEKPPLPPDYAAVSVSRSQRSDSRWYLTIALKKYEFLSHFAVLCEDLVESSRQASEQSAPAFLLSRLARWKRLMDEPRSDLLSDAELRGLVGELLFLKDTAIPRWGGSLSLTGWEGPFNAPHDFVFPELNVEVKTVRPGSSKARISSVEQLNSAETRLVLSVFTLARASEETEDRFAPVGLVRDLRDILESENILPAFETRLSASSYVDRPEYEQIFFRLQGIQLFKVEEGFPRIRRSDVPSGVVNISYEIDLSVCQEFKVGSLEEI
jgi:hypothetical protein